MPQVCDAPLVLDRRGGQDASRARRHRSEGLATKSSKAGQAVPFGFQLLLDLYVCKKFACDDLGLCYEFLEQLVGVLKVESQSPPFIFRTDAKRFPDKAGLSGWIPLVESGVQLHTLTVKDFISIDIYSCQPFEIEPIMRFVRSYFTPKRLDHQFVERGLDYHK